MKDVNGYQLLHSTTALKMTQKRDSSWIWSKENDFQLLSHFPCQRAAFSKRWRTLHWGRQEEYDGQSGDRSQCSLSGRYFVLEGVNHSDCLLDVDPTVTHHCHVTGLDLPINWHFFLFSYLCLWFLRSVTAVCYIWWLVTVHLSFLPEQRMINAVPPCLQLTQHADRVG